MKKLALLLIALIASGCSSDKDGGSIDTSLYPKESIYIVNMGNGWSKFKLNGNCYLNYRGLKKASVTLTKCGAEK